MCIAVWVWQAHPLYPLLLLLNRDEYHSRRTLPVFWWENSEILGGKDCLAGGTWLACSRYGRVAFLTNFREPIKIPQAKTRGDLPVQFLESDKSPLEFAEKVAKEGDQYNGFNLILADFYSKTMLYVTNRPKGKPGTVQEVSPGFHVLSNAALDTPWPKAERLARSFEELLQQYGEEIPEKEMAQQLMGDTVKADKDNLPDTGYGPEWEFTSSSIFIDTETDLGRYGTRSTSAMSINNQGDVKFFEKYFEDIWKEHTITYQIEKVE